MFVKEGEKVFYGRNYCVCIGTKARNIVENIKINMIPLIYLSSLSYFNFVKIITQIKANLYYLYRGGLEY